MNAAAAQTLIMQSEPILWCATCCAETAGAPAFAEGDDCPECDEDQLIAMRLVPDAAIRKALDLP